MDGSTFTRGGRGRGRGGPPNGAGGPGRPLSRNKHWSADPTSRGQNADSERWERGGHRGGGRGRGNTHGAVPKFHNVSLRLNNPSTQPAAQAAVEFIHTQPEETYEEEGLADDGVFDEEEAMGDQDEDEDDASGHVIEEPELETQEEREKFYQELVKAREVERRKAIAEGKMDDPLVPKRLEDAISIVGTCMDMAPRFERYRRERENNLFEWETIPGTKRVDHNRAVKMYERAAGDKTLPSDLRPPKVLKRTLDYLFHDLLPRGGFSATFNFIRDRSRSVRNDFTMQHITGPLAIECHDRCARFHVLALHHERDRTGFSIPLEEQQLMNTLQSLKEFYEDQRGRYESPTELEMRVYHRLIHIRDQKERHEDIPDHITSHPVFKLTTEFRLHVQKHSAPISKVSKLVVTDEGMQIFGQLAAVLNEQGNSVIVYLVACILERLFGKDTIEDIESIRGGLTIPQIIDGVSTAHIEEVHEDDAQDMQEVGTEDGMNDGLVDEGEEYYEDEETQEEEIHIEPAALPSLLKPSATERLSSNFHTQSAPTSMPSAFSGTHPVASSAFAGLVAQPNVFGTNNVFGNSVFSTLKTQSAPTSAFNTAPQSVFDPVATPQAPPIFRAGQPPLSNGSGPGLQQPQGSAFLSAPMPNAFGVEPPGVVSSSSTMPLEQPMAFSGGVSAPSNEFSKLNGANPFSAAGPSHITPSSTLNPKAAEYTPSQTSKPSFFSQPPSFPTNNGTATTTLEAKLPTAPSFPSPSLFTAANSTNPFVPPASQTPPPSFFNKPSPPSSASATPSLNRPSAPPLLKINTNTSSGSSSSSSIESPRVPPPLPKVLPVSLPSTPNTLTQPPNPHLGYLRNNLDSRGSPSNSSQEILSPLAFGTPTTSPRKPFHNFTPLSTPQPSRIFQAPSPPSTNGKGKAPDRSMYDDLEEVEEMKKKALTFAKKSSVVKETFRRWLKRATDRAAWLEACRHSDEYRKKMQAQGQNHGRHTSLLGSSRHGTPSDKKRRISTNGTNSTDIDMSPHKKRARKRMITEYHSPKTDEELAKRFKENHEEHELRWAQGSFLQVIRRQIKTRNPSTLKLSWNIWLSLNPESDATAIWLERKFDMPDSGAWVSESVFSIPLSSTSGSATSGYPGMIVFECTPLADIADDLEKKYRVLDDCSRLREAIKALPPQRHFVPSLLVICWTEEEQPSLAMDFFDMVKQLVSESIIQSFHTFAMTSATKDLDSKLEHILHSLDLDTEGKLIQSMTPRGVFKIFESTFVLFLNEWMENCTVGGRLNWNLYGQVVQASVSILNMISELVHHLLELPPLQDPLPGFDPSQVDDSESAYDDVNEWLSRLSTRDDARMVAMDLQSHRNIGQEFPIRVFIEHLYEITQTRFERLHPTTVSSHRPILIANIKLALKSFKEAMQPHQMRLLQTYNFSVRRSPKRRSDSVATSEQNSPEAKRPRLSTSEASSATEDFNTPSTLYLNGNGNQTPSPTNSTVSLAPTEAPTVTVAMLRALTRDLKKKYVGS